MNPHQKQNTQEELKEQDQILLKFINSIIAKIQSTGISASRAAYFQKVVKRDKAVWVELLTYVKWLLNESNFVHKPISGMWLITIEALLSNRNFYEWSIEVGKQIKANLKAKPKDVN